MVWCGDVCGVVWWSGVEWSILWRRVVWLSVEWSGE